VQHSITQCFLSLFASYGGREKILSLTAMHRWCAIIFDGIILSLFVLYDDISQKSFKNRILQKKFGTRFAGKKKKKKKEKSQIDK